MKKNVVIISCVVLFIVIAVIIKMSIDATPRNQNNSYPSSIDQQYESNVDNQDEGQNSNESVRVNNYCEWCNNSHKCSHCNGCGTLVNPYVLQYYQQILNETCIYCNGSGLCSCMAVLEEKASQATGYRKGKSSGGGSGRSVSEIEHDIKRTERLLESNRSDLERMQNNNSSPTMWPQYQKMIIDGQEKLESLQRELDMAN